MHAAQDPRADARVLLISSNSSAVSGPGFRSTCVADADLADVVQERAEAQDFELVVGQRICRPMATDTALTRSEWPAV